MEAIQDQVVLGNADAQIKLPKLIGQIAERLLAADPAVWRDAKNARAAVIYTLSGGQPRVIRKILELGTSPERETNLMKGALAYVERREAKAKQILLPIDAKTLAATVGGHIAMIQSALVSREDPAKAMRLLDQARLLTPGTLVEEAALRREIFLAGEIADLEQFSSLSSQYIRRFPNSVYADNFRRRFSDAITNFGLKSEASQFAKLEILLSELSSADQLQPLFEDRAVWRRHWQDRLGSTRRRASGSSFKGWEYRKGAIEALQGGDADPDEVSRNRRRGTRKRGCVASAQA